MKKRYIFYRASITIICDKSDLSKEIVYKYKGFDLVRRSTACDVDTLIDSYVSFDRRKAMEELKWFKEWVKLPLPISYQVLKSSIEEPGKKFVRNMVFIVIVITSFIASLIALMVKSLIN